MNDSMKRRVKSQLKLIHKETRQRKLAAEAKRVESLLNQPESHNEHPQSWRSMSHSDRRVWKEVARVRPILEAARVAVEKIEQKAATEAIHVSLPSPDAPAIA